MERQFNINSPVFLDREALEQLALKAVCAFQYYDLQYYLEITSDEELLAIMSGTYACNCDDCLAWQGGAL